MLARIVNLSIRSRGLVLALLVVVLVGGGVAVANLSIDAVPDLAGVQVTVLTEAPGLSAPEVEATVTRPIETGLNGAPNLDGLRSMSRGGLSAVTALFGEGTDVWFARQVTLERLRPVEQHLPAGTTTPVLAPVSGGLGQIFQFVVRGPYHSPMQLRTLLDWEIVPRLRSVPGVIEVNTMGGELKEYQVALDGGRLAAHGLTLRDVANALEEANVNVGGGYVERGAESLALRGVGRLTGERDIRRVVVRVAADGTPVLVEHVADVRIGAALRRGVVTRDGQGEAVTGVVMMLTGANSRDVIAGVKERVAQIKEDLPEGVEIDVTYDRGDFVGRTLSTVVKNLAEAALIVLVVLSLLLGSVRGAAVVVLGIPTSMAIAVFGMHLFGVPGNLMSLGAIDFGFLVDGAIVLLEAVVAASAGAELGGEKCADATRTGAAKLAARADRDAVYGEALRGVARPVAFAVAIILLVYLPLLALHGMEGKMFRPMALTMACALFGGLVYALFFFPALVVTFVPPAEHHGPRWIRWLAARYDAWLPGAVRHRGALLAGAAAALVVSALAFTRAGADFVPRIDEGDLVITIRRAPSINISEARRLDLQVERVLRGFPEVMSAVGMTGRAEVAVDPVGTDSTDVVAHLRPKSEWRTAKDLDGLSAALKSAIESHVPGTFVSVSQPIEDKTNELISGSRADVQIQISGKELEELRALGDRVGALVRAIPGSGDVRVERVLGLPSLTVTPDRERMARYGVHVEDALAAVEAARVGLPVGVIYEGRRRFDLRMLLPPRAPTADALGDMFIPTTAGKNIPLAEVATIEDVEGPTQIRHDGMDRTLRVEVNLRGRDLVSWVDEARAAVGREVALPEGYDIHWAGQFANFQRAKARLMIVVPISVAVIGGMLLAMFQRVRFALAVFSIVPLALTGGLLGLLTRGLSFSIPAAVGFVALAGVAVLNGVVLVSEVKRRLDEGAPLDDAIREGSTHTFLAVLTTGAVAAFGFLPMALSHGAGAEVQRPLATVVVAGILLSTALALFVLPGVLRALLAGTARRAPESTSS